MAIYMLTTARKGVPSTQLARELGVTQKAAWFLAHRIRETWLSQLNSKGMGPIVEVVNHSVGEFVRGMVHTNGIESFWALLKRGYYGIYHHMSAKHLYRYINEFSFRSDTARADTVKFIAMTVGRMENCRLTYRRLTNATQA